MLWLGQEAKARGLAELLTKPAHQARIFLLMARRLREAPGHEREARQMFLRVEQAIATLSGSNKAEALRELIAALVHAGEWQQAEQVIATLPEEDKAEVLRELAAALAQAGEWQQAEQVIATLPEGWAKARALSELAAALAQQNKEREVVRLIQREWSRTTRRDESLNLLPLAFGLFPRYPELGPALFDAFAWVDAFLQPSPPPDDPEEEQEGS
jgi:thioredoxin-like negative regulator of GroEL